MTTETAPVIKRQRGVVLITMLIVLVAMIFAGIALMRSVDTAALVAGNMGFRQAATHQGDFGTEAAVAWLQGQNAGTGLQANNYAAGYSSVIAGPSASQTWDQYWNGSLDKSPVSRPVTTAGGVNSGSVWTLPTTANGYTVSYVIHRMCGSAGVVSSSNCVQAPTGSVSGPNSMKAGNPANFTQNSQIYYRITSRIEGPRNTVSYTQAVVAM
ncbi:hypothetical protein GN109_24875 [Collimonas pratensis]|uniref:pilus assembly PilX family protein n=1 Tax=Collimonas pratensis TaxID=279113 RepID=UPI00143CF55E|nr:hypothetical protein [Collimonas pratensis]NKI72658.1 hypothetical protein [Collimonas pratensis]